jgi:hypothetical protein
MIFITHLVMQVYTLTYDLFIFVLCIQERSITYRRMLLVATITDPIIASVPQTANNNKKMIIAINKLFKIAFMCNNIL